MKVKVSEAKGRVLDYLAAQAMGRTIYRSKTGRWMIANYGDFKYKHGVSRWFEPTISWAQGGPIIERERISIEDCQDGAGLYWEATRIEPPAVSEARGPTPLIAVMRCYVISKLGDEVEVPDEMAS